MIYDHILFFAPPRRIGDCCQAVGDRLLAMGDPRAAALAFSLALVLQEALACRTGAPTEHAASHRVLH